MSPPGCRNLARWNVYLLLNFSMLQEMTALFKNSRYPSSKFPAPVSASGEQVWGVTQVHCASVSQSVNADTSGETDVTFTSIKML